jgi:hypothetical protein
MMISSQNSDHITELVADLVPKSIAILQYVDDAIMCLEDNMEKTRNMKILLYIFEHMSDSKINFEKS